MEYKLNTTNYRDFKVIEDNKLAGRAYFIPYSKKEKLCAVDLRHERTDSDLVEVLSGEWDFKYYNDISLIPEVFDAAGVEFDRIHVPLDMAAHRLRAAGLSQLPLRVRPAQPECTRAYVRRNLPQNF